ncbi:MAG TPA: hypothetical protein VEH00_09175 [Steroidobacteraceae bacterium]|nr:hypothetical protein [Steroidobacteraceae bacterium]
MRNLVRGLIAALLLAVLPVVSQAGIFVSVTIAPPVLPVYVQPPIPGPGYIWAPGYWAWDGSYYWVPGTWVLAPVGLLWTPGYWGWSGGVYLWHAGYWGPHVGFYGGVNYGFGYGGVGFAGGEWRGGQLYYNRSVTNVTTTNISNVYNRTVVNNGPVSHVSFNGGAGGIVAQPNAAEMAAGREHHEGPIQAQAEHQNMAAHNNQMRASFNGGHPAIAATAHAGVFTGAGVVAAHGAAAAHAAAATHGGNYPQTAHPQTHGGAYPQTHGTSEPPRGGFQPQPQHAQPRGNAPRGNESHGNQREERPQRDDRPPHMTRAQPSGRAPVVAHQPQALPKRVARAPQARPQPQRQARNDPRAEHRHS